MPPLWLYHKINEREMYKVMVSQRERWLKLILKFICWASRHSKISKSMSWSLSSLTHKHKLGPGTIPISKLKVKRWVLSRWSSFSFSSLSCVNIKQGQFANTNWWASIVSNCPSHAMYQRIFFLSSKQWCIGQGVER